MTREVSKLGARLRAKWSGGENAVVALINEEGVVDPCEFAPMVLQIERGDRENAWMRATQTGRALTVNVYAVAPLRAKNPREHLPEWTIVGEARGVPEDELRRGAAVILVERARWLYPKGKRQETLRALVARAGVTESKIVYCASGWDGWAVGLQFGVAAHVLGLGLGATTRTSLDRAFLDARGTHVWLPMLEAKSA